MAWIDFKEVKGLVTMSVLLQRYRIQLRGNGVQLKGDCPLPTHSSSHRGSFNVNLDRNIWSCKSESCIANRHGREGGNVLDFVMRMENCDLRSAAEKIVEWHGTKPSPAPSLASSPASKPAHNTSERSPASSLAADTHTLVDWLTSNEQKNGAPSDVLEAPMEVISESGGEPQPQPDNSSLPVAVKGYMRDVDQWLDGLLVDPVDWKKFRNAIKARLIESYNNGRQARA